MHTFLLLPPLLYLLHILYKSLTSPLLTLPGPFWTRFTKLWYFNRVRSAHFETDNINLHQRYGPIVRISPDHYSIADPAAVKTIYGTGSKFTKSAWYEGWKHPSPERWTLFPDRDVRRHAETRKRFSSLYSMSSLVHYEAFVDDCADIFSRRLEEHADKRQELNMGHWFQCYAFDVISSITFGGRFGFLSEGKDIEGAMAALQKLMMYSTLVGIYPQWHPRLFGPLSRFSWSGAGGRAYIMQYVQGKIARHNDLKADPEAGLRMQTKTQDFLEKMVLARDKDPQKVTDYHLFMMGQSNVIAGSDTTAISLSAILYHCLRRPGVLDKLRKEIDSFTEQGRCSEKATFKESQEMPYFQAVVKEALRMHSATGLPLWREVPAGGAEISGRFFPAGMVVGINTWVAHYNEDIFPDAKTFRPDRWIEAENYPERLKVMNDMYMPFGLGSRTCLGKHISILEMSKLIPRLVRDFDFELVNPEREWETENFWFVKPVNFDVRVKRRNSIKQ
ncbi:cytochrome P450 [Aspergillus ruber CBS 135680]|uniref:Putative cytochrome P450 pisatin demethylase n=1 Tax=Aspergillus ruber (strain CBS 135680) TaxID=1388766 RepID=A0A017S061_ASPRC|nr:putative cytochrome P450 pisatin demethylase [Aspergillus ruber CBS 135680]EYE90342.1 putative cytochrome P450 pisatin demethylase [Aspergillus ruber CBS 135680]